MDISRGGDAILQGGRGTRGRNLESIPKFSTPTKIAKIAIFNSEELTSEIPRMENKGARSRRRKSICPDTSIITIRSRRNSTIISFFPPQSGVQELVAHLTLVSSISSATSGMVTMAADVSNNWKPWTTNVIPITPK
jgi:hypothetical protein